MARRFFLIYAVTFITRAIFLPSVYITYDETAYAETAARLALEGGWWSLYSNSDLFFFPPLFNYLSGLLVLSGLEPLYAVRLVCLVFSSAIPPMLYLLMKRSGQKELSAICASFFWYIVPAGTYYSIAGTVEMPMLFFLLLSLYWLTRIDEPRKKLFIAFSAVSMGCAVWTKETAVGAVFIIPVFLFFRNNWKVAIEWTAVTLVSILPLIAQSFIPHEYDLFFEVTTPLLQWSSFVPDRVLINLGMINGIYTLPFSGISLTLTMLLCALIVFSIASFFSSGRGRNPFFFSVSTGILIVYFLFFSLFPKKFDYYILLIYLFSLPFLASFVSSRRIMLVIFAVPMIAISLFSFSQVSYRQDEAIAYESSFQIMMKEKSAPVVVSTMPAKLRYMVREKKVPVKVISAEWLHCNGDPAGCILPADYLISSDQFLRVLFCQRWPISPENCDFTAYATFFDSYLEPIEKFDEFTLYRIRK